MLNLLVRGGITILALLTASACTDNQGTIAKAPDHPKDPPRKKDDFPRTDFGGDAKAASDYLALRNAGVPASRFDQGCPQIQYGSNGIETIQVIRRKTTGACEVNEVVFQEYKRFPWLVESSAGKPISWSLNDFDPFTSFDETIRQKVRDHKQYLSQLLQQKGYAKDSLEHQERMVAGLFYLASSAYTGADRTAQELSNLKNQLQQLGLAEYLAYVQEGRGFKVQQRVIEQGSALKALETGEGGGGEILEILYGIFEEAGFQPSFALVNPYRSEEPALKAYVQKNPGFHPLCIGVPLEGKLRLFDPSLAKIDPLHHGVLPVTLRHYVSFKQVNEGSYAKKRGQYTDALNSFNAALRLNSSLYSAYDNRAGVWEDLRERDQALRDFSRAIAINPFASHLYFNRALLLTRQNRDQPEPSLLEKALTDTERALKLPHSYAPTWLLRGEILATMGRKDEAIQALTNFLKSASPQEVDKVLEPLRTLFARQWTSEAAQKQREIIEKETELDVVKASSNAQVAVMLWKLGERGQARRQLIPLMALLSSGGSAEKVKKISPPTRDYLRNQLFSSIPDDMRASLELQALNGYLR
jgi:tetratricopeptide (TPR) repeat protein